MSFVNISIKYTNFIAKVAKLKNKISLGTQQIDSEKQIIKIT